MSDLFNQEPYPAVETVQGDTMAALLGDGSPVRADPEDAEVLAAAGASVGRYVLPDHCPSCGIALPDPSHPVDASLRRRA